MNNKLLAATMFVSIAMGAYSAPIYTVLDLNSSLLIQNESSKDSLESDSEKLLLAVNPKKKSKSSKKKEIEEDIEDLEENDDVDSDEVDDSEDIDDGDDSDSARHPVLFHRPAEPLPHLAGSRNDKRAVPAPVPPTAP